MDHGHVVRQLNRSRLLTHLESSKKIQIIVGGYLDSFRDLILKLKPMFNVSILLISITQGEMGVETTTHFLRPKNRHNELLTVEGNVFGVDSIN